MKRINILLAAGLLAVLALVLASCSFAPEATGVSDDSVMVNRAAVFTENTSLPQAVRDYYRSAYGLSGSALKAKLQTIISTGYVDKGYNGLWTTYKTADVTPANKIWDLYSSTSLNATGTTASYWFTPVTSQCGTYSAEGGCYNREHMIPQSTFGEKAPMVSDAHHITATDGKVNGQRSNYPHATVGTASWTSKNGGKLGTTSASGLTGTAFEPVAQAKGDIARMYMYFSVRYYGNSSCTAWAAMAAGAKLKSWAQTLYRTWSAADPVSQKEKTRNNAIYAIQKNRNPFIDYPELATLIDFVN